MGTDGGTLAALSLPASAGAAGADAAPQGAPADCTVAPAADGAAAPVRGESPARCEAAASAHGAAGAGGAGAVACACKSGTPASADGAASAARGQLPGDVSANMADWNLLQEAPSPAGSAAPAVGADGDAADPQPDPAVAAPDQAPAPDQAAERAPDAAAAAEASESCESITQESSQARACACTAPQKPLWPVAMAAESHVENGFDPSAGS